MITDFFVCDPAEIATRFPDYVVPGPDFMPDEDAPWRDDDPFEGLAVFQAKRIDDFVMNDVAAAFGVAERAVGQPLVAPDGGAYLEQLSPALVDALAHIDDAAIAAFVARRRADLSGIGGEEARAAALSLCTVEAWTPTLRELANFARGAQGAAVFRFVAP